MSTAIIEAIDAEHAIVMGARLALQDREEELLKLRDAAAELGELEISGDVAAASERELGIEPAGEDTSDSEASSEEAESEAAGEEEADAAPPVEKEPESRERPPRSETGSAVLEFVNGRPETRIADVRAGLSLSTKTASSWLRRLAEEGKIARRLIDPKNHRMGTVYSPLKAAAKHRTPTAAEREARKAGVEDTNRRLLGWISRQGSVTVADVAEELEISEKDAQRKLQGLAHNTSLKKGVDGSWAVVATQPYNDGARTEPERRVMAAVREAGGSIDETTLAHHAACSTNDLRVYASGLVQRRALVKREVDGTRLYELPGRPNL